jgi:hypothetical protein
MRKIRNENRQERVLARALAVELARVQGGNRVCATGKSGGGADVTDTNHGDGCPPLR